MNTAGHSLWFFVNFGHQIQTHLFPIKPTHLHFIFFITTQNTLIYREIFNIPFTTQYQFFYCWLLFEFWRKKIKKMSHMGKAWIVAASVGAVEALKDQGFCRWNYTMRSIHQHARNSLRSFSQVKKLSSSSAMVSSRVRDEKAKQSEESLRTVMYLSCWGPNWGSRSGYEDDDHPTTESSMEGISQESDKNNLRPLSQARSLSSSSSYKMGVKSSGEDEKRKKKTQKTLGKVMH